MMQADELFDRERERERERDRLNIGMNVSSVRCDRNKR